MSTRQLLGLAPAPARAAVRRVHADRVAYKAWTEEHWGSYAVRWARLDDYDRFVDRWPSLQDWFDAPLRQRLLDKENAVRGQQPHGGASVIMPYLSYLSLVHGRGLDYPLLLARTFTSPFMHQARHGGLGVNADLFDRYVVRLTELGYTTARTQLVWPLGRMLLHQRGGPSRRPGPDRAERGRPRRAACGHRRLYRPPAPGSAARVLLPGTGRAAT